MKHTTEGAFFTMKHTRIGLVFTIKHTEDPTNLR